MVPCIEGVGSGAPGRLEKEPDGVCVLLPVPLTLSLGLGASDTVCLAVQSLPCRVSGGRPPAPENRTRMCGWMPACLIRSPEPSIGASQTPRPMLTRVLPRAGADLLIALRSGPLPWPHQHLPKHVMQMGEFTSAKCFRKCTELSNSKHHPPRTREQYNYISNT